MPTPTPEQLTAILEQHKLWVADHESGERADLQGANLQGANLQEANLQRADLGASRVVQVGPLGSRKDYLVVKQFADGIIEAQAGCFCGTLEELEEAVAKTHATHPRYRMEYTAAIAYCRSVFALRDTVKS